LPLLKQYLARAAAAIDGDGLVAEINARDYERLSKKWEAFCREAGVVKRISLSADPLPCLGGVRVRNAENTVRVDSTFEGKMERRQDELHQAVMERLLASTAHMGALSGG